MPSAPPARDDFPPIGGYGFLSDCHTVGSLSRSRRILGKAVPVINKIGIYGIVLSKVIQRLVLTKSLNDVVRLVDAWNTAFFLPRRVSVWVRKGRKRISGAPQERELSNYLLMRWRGEERRGVPKTLARDLRAPVLPTLRPSLAASDTDVSESDRESLRSHDGDTKLANNVPPHTNSLRNLRWDDWKGKVYLIVECVA